MTTDIVFIGPPGYRGIIVYDLCNDCKGKHRQHRPRSLQPVCQTCNGQGIVAVPERVKKLIKRTK